MIYQVTARFKPETAVELRRRLDDGSIAAQQPDGRGDCCFATASRNDRSQR